MISKTDSLLMSARSVCDMLHVSFQALVKGFGIDEKNMFEFWDVSIMNTIMIRVCACVNCMMMNLRVFVGHRILLVCLIEHDTQVADTF